MPTIVYRYRFQGSVRCEDVEAALLLSLFACESLHGESQFLLDKAHYLDWNRRACVIEAETQVGRDLNRIFVGFLRREHGRDGFRVERVTEPVTENRKVQTS